MARNSLAPTWEFDTITLDFTTSHLPGFVRPLLADLLPACDWPQFFTLVSCLRHFSRLKLVFERVEDWVTFKNTLAECDCAAVSRGRRPLLAAALRPDHPALTKEMAEMEPLTILQYLIQEEKFSCELYESGTGCRVSILPEAMA